MLFRTVPSPTTYGLWNWGFATELPHLISETGKATDFKFGGYIYWGDPNKSPFKILEKVERGRMQGLSNFFGHPLLSLERVKLRTSNFVGTFIESIGTKPKMLGIVSVGVVQWIPKNFRAPMYKTHCAVIFAIAQLSCYFKISNLCDHKSPTSQTCKRTICDPKTALCNTRKLCYRKDDRAMRPTYGCPEYFRDSLTTPTALFPTFSWAYVPINPMNVPKKFEVRSFTQSWDNRGYPKNLGSPWIRPLSLFSKILMGFLFG